MNTANQVPFHSFVSTASLQNETAEVETVEQVEETTEQSVPVDPDGYWKDYNEFLVNLA